MSLLVPGDIVALTQTIGMIDSPIPGGPVIAVGPGRPGRPPKYVLEAGTELRVLTFSRDESVVATTDFDRRSILGIPTSALRLVRPNPKRDAVIAAERAERDRVAAAQVAAAKRKRKPRPTHSIPKDCAICWVRDTRKLARLGFDRESAEAAGEQAFDEVGIHIADDERVEFVAICGASVVGAITYAEREGSATLSVAVDPDWQKKNLGRRLAEALLEKRGDGNYYVQVINPNMAKILEDLGFEAESRSGWSRESPMMSR